MARVEAPHLRLQVRNARQPQPDMSRHYELKVLV